MRQLERQEEYEERFALVSERVDQLKEDAEVPDPFASYFKEVAAFLGLVKKTYVCVAEGAYERLSLEERQKIHADLYGRLEPAVYEASYLNPEYAEETLGAELGGMLSMLYADLLSTIPDAFEERLDLLCIWNELFVELHGCFVEEMQEMGTETGAFSGESLKWIAGNVKDAIYWFYHDYAESFVPDTILPMIDPSYDFFTKWIEEADLSGNAYLYRIGAPVGKNELLMADYLRKMPQDQIDAMAHTFTEGYRKGFEMAGKDIHAKKTVKIEAPLGMERMVKAAMAQFADMGLKTTILREATISLYGRGGGKRGYYSVSPNRQYDYDHKDDKAYYFDKSFVERRLEVMRDTFEKEKDKALTFGGPAVVEVFGEEPFAPVNKEANAKYSDKQNSLNVYNAVESGKITNTYIPGESYSFTIIAYPLPAIGDQFEEIFAKTVELNTLDYEKYQTIQQHIIDTLDQGQSVHVTGRGDNHTDIRVQLHPLADPAKETIFENCVADVNIPVGEVFTSPVLEGTNGVLHVTQVYLGELCYKDLEVVFTDGKITAYDCANFETEAENKKYIQDNVLYHHKTLPLGEFAIGTNTTAYRMARDYDIADKLPILIAEKTGPHFAVGDTCYSHAEDVPMYNPDGKEVVARDNSVSLLRKDPKTVNPAYFNCHTDITIPYDELGDIVVECADGRKITILSQGRFVLPGTEELNVELER